jgi:hypothetical protein
VVVSNAVIGLVQELRAKRTHDRLLLLSEGRVRTLRDGDRVIAGAGYNLYWESHYFGFLPHMHFVGLSRKIDDQEWRASLERHPALPTLNGADILASQITKQFG